MVSNGYFERLTSNGGGSINFPEHCIVIVHPSGRAYSVPRTVLFLLHPHIPLLVRLNHLDRGVLTVQVFFLFLNRVDRVRNHVSH